ncbi:MAG: hypothetical protein RIQ89_833 [Bacteroidota bacterium]|jgi:7-carboxy-7-deazaguanine synthase
MQLPVMEHFYTIQGEGYNTGKPAYFIRLGGCDVGCVWCDVKDSWDAAKHPTFSLNEIVDWVKVTPARNVVITGGEPCMHNLCSLTEIMHLNNYHRWIETSGAHPLTGEWDWICVSPKKFMPPIKEVLQKADELKIVVYNSSDLDWALSHAPSVRQDCKLYLQPEYSKFQKSIPLIIDFVKDHPNWQISIQTHKIINVP